MEILNGYSTLDLGVDEITTSNQKVEGIHARFVELIKLKKPIMIPPVKLGSRYFGAQFIVPKYSTLSTTIFFEITPVPEATTINTNSPIMIVVYVGDDDNIKYVSVKYTEQA